MNGTRYEGAETWKNDGGKACYPLAFGWPAYQLATGIRDFRTYFPKEKE